MARIATEGALIRRHAPVVANIELPGVPVGTPGKVLLPTGLTWKRYRVLFDNGVERGQLDRRHVVPPDEFVPLEERIVEEETAAEGDVAAADGEGGAVAADNPYGVPAHLLERSKRARERLAAG
jgi:hypothetical protein